MPGMSDPKSKTDDRLDFATAGVRVLADKVLRATGMERARLEVRLTRQLALVEQLRASSREPDAFAHRDP